MPFTWILDGTRLSKIKLPTAPAALANSGPSPRVPASDKNTIEEQIVSLHRHKRDLSDSVLEGGKISA